MIPGEGALLPADVQQVLALVQVFRVRPHVVPQLQQTVGEAFEDGVAAGGPAHSRQHRHWGEGGVTAGSVQNQYRLVPSI